MHDVCELQCVLFCLSIAALLARYPVAKNKHLYSTKPAPVKLCSHKPIQFRSYYEIGLCDDGQLLLQYVIG